MKGNDMKPTVIRSGGVEIEINDPTQLPAILAALHAAPPPPAPIGEFISDERLQARHEVKGLVIPDFDPDDDPQPTALASVSPIGPVERIPLLQNLLDVLNVVLTFPEGISAKGIGQLLPITETKPTAVGNRLYRLKLMGLVEKVDGHWIWRATQRARDAKLIAA